MTLVVAVGCSDGVVLAADSASTDFAAGTKQQSEKIRTVHGQPAVWGGAGDVGLLQKIGYRLEKVTVSSDILAYRKRVRDAVVPEMKAAVSNHVERPRGSGPPDAALLVASIVGKKPCIIEIDVDGRDTDYGATYGNFAAIGSGKPWAHAIFRPYITMERSVDLGKVFAYRILEDAIEISAAGLALPIHMTVLRIDGSVDQCSFEELDGLQQTCNVWRELARETIGQLASPELKPQQPSRSIPSPESA